MVHQQLHVIRNTAHRHSTQASYTQQALLYMIMKCMAGIIIKYYTVTSNLTLQKPDMEIAKIWVFFKVWTHNNNRTSGKPPAGKGVVGLLKPTTPFPA